MTPIKDYIAQQFVGKKLHLKCDCIVGLDVTGPCIKYELSSSEIILIIDTNGRYLPVGLNTPKLQIEILKS